MPAPQVTVSVNLVAFSVKMKAGEAKTDLFYALIISEGNFPNRCLKLLEKERASS